MNEKEFMELLDYYFRDVEGYVYKEIKADYEEHFRMGKTQGKSEEEISRSLGSPKEIYEEFKEEGIFTESKKSGFNKEFFSDIADKIGNIFTKKEKSSSAYDVVMENERIETPIHRIEVKVANTDVYIENHNEDYIEVTHTAAEEQYDFTVLKEGTTLKVGTYDASKFDINKYFSFGIKSPVKEIYIKIPIGNEANINISSESGDGRVYVNKNNVNFLSASGNLDLETKGSMFKGNSASGKFNIRGVKNNINVNNISGDINIDADNPTVNIDTVSGNFKFKFINSNNISINTVSGEIKGEVENMNFNIDISTISGDISVREESGFKKNIGKSYRNIIGRSNSRMYIRTVSGNIKIR
ncbi:DUF4097 family beta strand repeat-containing protein [Miniphocaeibacter massiliensis]|uniref:DUF4097 family beta strand repeat-containing protein n=1 Tax=Miniphocaeibacter massiliensis TaxID=2041841 RepID=UPI000C1C6DDD|nr:DUF4097 family beta strand repeat-containing protein [Miniphocaeibacter massiliensis]